MARRPKSDANATAIIRAGLPPLPTAEDEEARKEKQTEELERTVAEFDAAREDALKRTQEAQAQAQEDAAAREQEASESDSERSAMTSDGDREEVATEVEERLLQGEVNSSSFVQSPSPVAQAQIITERLHRTEGAEVGAAATRMAGRPGDARDMARTSRTDKGTVTRVVGG